MTDLAAASCRAHLAATRVTLAAEHYPTPTVYSHPYETPAHMAPGHATLRGDCDDNYIDNWVPRTIDMPPVGFEMSAPDPEHDRAPGPPHG